VPVTVKIPGRELALAKHFGAEHTLIDFVCEIKDETSGMTVSNVRDNVNIKLSDATAAELAHRPVEYDTGFTLLPGRYTIKFLARDDETGRIGTYQTSFTIPNLNKEAVRVPISSVVLSSQRADVRDAIYSAAKGKDQAKNIAANPLIDDGHRLLPSVTRVFNTARPMYVYLQAYAGAQPPAGSATPSTPSKPAAQMVAFVSLYREGKKAWESQAVSATPIAGNRLGVTPLRFEVALGNLDPGEYQCEVTVLDPEGGRASFWMNPILLVK
jgi:hypothetical protein